MAVSVAGYSMYSVNNQDVHTLPAGSRRFLAKRSVDGRGMRVLEPATLKTTSLNNAAWESMTPSMVDFDPEGLLAVLEKRMRSRSRVPAEAKNVVLSLRKALTIANLKGE